MGKACCCVSSLRLTTNSTSGGEQQAAGVRLARPAHDGHLQGHVHLGTPQGLEQLPGGGGVVLGRQVQLPGELPQTGSVQDAWRRGGDGGPGPLEVLHGLIHDARYRPWRKEAEAHPQTNAPQQAQTNVPQTNVPQTDVPQLQTDVPPAPDGAQELFACQYVRLSPGLASPQTAVLQVFIEAPLFCLQSPPPPAAAAAVSQPLLSLAVMCLTKEVVPRDTPLTKAPGPRVKPSYGSRKKLGASETTAH
ncbi:hypothetical protein CRUP_006245 [Coryphaenoides rupestris]|nr:hypothetical protein CRUP_006245 [Coryphaenoides rupestris]